MLPGQQIFAVCLVWFLGSVRPMKTIYFSIFGASLHLFTGEKEMGDVLTACKSVAHPSFFNDCEK